MSQDKEKAPAGTGAGGTDNTTAGAIVTPDDSTDSRDGQNSDGGNGAGPDWLEIAVGHASSAMDDIEYGLLDILPTDLAALERVRTAQLTKAENEALNTLIVGLAQGRSPGVQTQILNELNLGLETDALAELAAAVGILPRGISWEEMAQLVKDPSWCWEPWLPRGFVTILAGEPGEGKSMLCLKIAACFLRGDPWPDGSPCETEPGAVLWCEAESAQALNLGRAKAWELPIDRIYSPKVDDNPMTDVALDLTEHQDEVAAMANMPDVRLIIVDSLRGAHRGDENSSISMVVVQWLATLARDTDKPVLLTHHLRKRGFLDLSNSVHLERVRGSSAIIQTSRVVWAIDRPDLEIEKRRLSTIKNNLARFAEPIGLAITDVGMQFGDAPEKPREDSPMERAIDMLLAVLSHEPIKQIDVKQEAEGMGISMATLNRAKKKLAVVSKKQEDAWYWALPAKDTSIN